MDYLWGGLFYSWFTILFPKGPSSKTDCIALIFGRVLVHSREAVEENPALYGRRFLKALDQDSLPRCSSNNETLDGFLSTP